MNCYTSLLPAASPAHTNKDPSISIQQPCELPPTITNHSQLSTSNLYEQKRFDGLRNPTKNRFVSIVEKEKSETSAVQRMPPQTIMGQNVPDNPIENNARYYSPAESYTTQVSISLH